MDFFDWETLVTFSGSLTMVLIITQFTKNIKYIKSIPTQLWSYIVSLIVMFTSNYFTGKLDVSSATLILFNGIIVALTANGGFDALKRVSVKNTFIEK